MASSLQIRQDREVRKLSFSAFANLRRAKIAISEFEVWTSEADVDRERESFGSWWHRDKKLRTRCPFRRGKKILGLTMSYGLQDFWARMGFKLQTRTFDCNFFFLAILRKLSSSRSHVIAIEPKIDNFHQSKTGNFYCHIKKCALGV